MTGADLRIAVLVPCYNEQAAVASVVADFVFLDQNGNGARDPGDGSGAPAAKMGQCPNCGAAALTHQEGCDICLNCGYSRCG